MTPAVLSRALRLLEDRLVQLEERVRQGDEGAWSGYCEAVRALAVVMDLTAPGARGALLTTKQLAERLNISAKTLLRRKRAGQVTPAIQLGKRGRAAIRWKGTEAIR